MQISSFLRHATVTRPSRLRLLIILITLRVINKWNEPAGAAAWGTVLEKRGSNSQQPALRAQRFGVAMGRS